MDRKTILVLIVSLVALTIIQLIVPRFFPPIPLPPKPTNQLAGATNTLGTNTAAQPATNTSVAITPSPVAQMGPATPTPITINSNAPEQLEVIETADAIYTFTSHGGGLKRVNLKRYLEIVGCERVQGTNTYATLNDHARVPVLAMGADQAFGDNVFTLRRAGNGVVAEKTVNGLKVTKEFVITTNYQIASRIRVENTGGQNVALPVQTVSVGTATPMSPRDPQTMLGVFWYDGRDAQHIRFDYFEEKTGWCLGIGARPAQLEYTSGPNRILWAAAHNQFFTIVVAPATNSLAAQFDTQRINLPPPTAEEIAADSKVVRAPYGLESTISYPAVNLAPNQAIERTYTVYAGPKQEKLLSRVGRHTDYIMDFGFFGMISKFMLRVMNFIHGLIEPIVPPALGKYAMALVLMTVLIKLVFWPLTQKSTRSMKKMQALSPELKKLQEKYKDDPVKMNRKVMEFWRENKVSPLSGCWPMLIQLPIFFALFQMIPNAIELRGTPFLWACDLSKQDTIYVIPGLGFPLNPLPLLMGLTMFIQARMTPAAPGMDPAQQAIMRYMPLIFMVFLYTQPAGLTLYWTVQNLLTILQTKLTHTEETPAAPAAPAAPVKKKK
jgi:YidC/Oxa1 family membrane protein insertase